MTEIRTIERLIEAPLEALGFSLVRVRLSGGGRQALQVMAERSDGSGISVDDCAELSRAISAILDVGDPLPGPYVLEVSSPGIERPLVRIGDFERFVGREARIETARPIGGRRRFRGTLLGVSEALVRITQDGEPAHVPFQDITRAKLIVPEAQIGSGLNQQDL